MSDVITSENREKGNIINMYLCVWIMHETKKKRPTSSKRIR